MAPTHESQLRYAVWYKQHQERQQKLGCYYLIDADAAVTPILYN